MVIFHSYVTNYQRVKHREGESGEKRMKNLSVLSQATGSWAIRSYCTLEAGSGGKPNGKPSMWECIILDLHT